MDSTTHFESSRRAHSASASEVKDSATGLLKSELRLAAAEIKHATGHVKAQSTTLLIASGAALLGLLPMMAFLVIGLGDILNHNYWLSSLIVFLVFTGIGGLVAYGAVKKMKAGDLSLPRTRRSLSETADGLSRTADELKDTARVRMHETAKSFNIRRPV
jgi:hypothetical protein